MTGIIILMGFLLMALIILVPLLVRLDGEGPPPMQTKTLREIERALLEIQNTSHDVYAQGKASECVEKVRNVLDRH